MISHSTSPIIFTHRMFGVAFTELLFLLLLSHDRIVEIKVFSGAPHSLASSSCFLWPIASSFTFTLALAHSVISPFVHLCWWFDHYWNALCKMFYLFSCSALLFFSFLSFPSSSPSSASICCYLYVSFSISILLFWPKTVNQNKNNLRALMLTLYTQGV